MSDLQLIEETLRRTAWRRRWLRAWRGLGHGMFWGALLWFVSLSLYKLLPLPPELVLFSGGMALAFGAVGALAGFWRRMSPLQAAQWVDDRGGLKERLSTAMELSGQEPSENWHHLVLADAARHLREINPLTLLPFRVPVLTRWALLLLVLGAGLGFVPEYRTEAYQKRLTEAAHIREVGRKLAEVTRQHLEKRPPALASAQASLEQVAELGATLSKIKLTRSEALSQISSALRKLESETDTLADNPTLRSLEQAARQPGGSGALADQQGLQNQMDALQKALGQAAGDPEKLDDLQQKLQKLQQAARNQSGPEGSQAGRQQLAQSLAELAEQTRDQGISLPGLEEAIAALQNNQTDVMLRDLQAALHDLENLKGMARSMQQLQQQMARLGKDLAEQLEQGQVEAARGTLEKMAQQLGRAGLAPDQVQQIADEVAKAIDPAGEYGQVARHLQDAVRQMNQGQNPGAAESLAAAAEELEKLKQQLQDAQSLMAAMQALDQAQQAIASGKSWEQCQGGICQVCGGVGCSACQKRIGTRWGQGGGGGAGVGTWADEQGWTYSGPQEPVDNSRVIRPDLDSRGLSDRPDDRNPNLNPTKVRGQMAPGRSMPSITLKGVHLKGESNVQFEEAATAAQADAQSALNQDKVPRPYLNTVRDYFDDLKE